MGVAVVSRGGADHAQETPDEDIRARRLGMGVLRDLPLRHGLEEALDAATPPAVATPTPVPDVPEPASTTQSRVQGQVYGQALMSVWVTFYSCPPYCGDPAGPLPLGEGQAACDWVYMGRRFMLNGQEWVCNDTGELVKGAHIDLFFWNEAAGWAYLSKYGTEGELEWLD